MKRRADVKHYLVPICRRNNINLRMIELDVLRSRKHDLSQVQRRSYYISCAKRGTYDIILASPPCGTFSRARWANSDGPKPLRLQHCPRGFPWLTGAQRQGVDMANAFVDFTVNVLSAHFGQNTRAAGLMEHPEDLGQVRTGHHPGSAWQFHNVRGLLRFAGVLWGALAQSDFGTRYPKPTRLLGRLDGLDKMIYEGAPAFDTGGHYTGPLPPRSKASPMMLGRLPDGSFRSEGTAAWPPELCKCIANCILAHFLRSTDKTLKGGEEAKDCETQPEEKGEIQPGEGEPESKKGADQVSPLDEPVFEVPEFSAELDLGFPEPGATTRRKITPAEAERVRRGSSIEDLYIGRNSVWGNPFKIGPDGDRKTVIRKFEEYLEASGLGRKVAELRGCVLVCHCEKEQPCHGDVLIRRADAGRKAPEEGREQGQDHALNNEDAQPMRDVDEFAAGQDQRESWSPMDGTVSGSIGQGAPRVAEFMGSFKAFADGGGLCSPGRWAPEARVVQDYGLNEIRDTLYDHFRRATREEKGNMTPTMNFALRLASGKYQKSPFKEEHLEDARKDMANKLGADNDILAVAPGQEFRLDLVARLLQKVGDPDWDFFLQLKEGVSLGVDEEMARTPAVFEEKIKWKLDEVDGPGIGDRENYKSAEGHLEQVEELFREEQKLGWMVELDEADARKEYGDRLFIASLAVVQEPGKIRVVHDGSNGVHINHRIRPRDQVRAPGAGEIRSILRSKAASGRKLFAIAGDISKAHRRIKIKRQDWGFQACRTRPGKVWLNCVGTYGMASASYYWSRAAAGLIVRLTHYVLGGSLPMELLLYVDDFLFLAESQPQVEAIGFAVFFLSLLGVPFSWKKFKGGTELDWIGYWMDVRASRFGVSLKRATWLSSWLRARVAEGRVDMRDLEAVLGRLCFAVGPLEFLRPFLAPIYAWVAAVAHRGIMVLPWSVRFLFVHIADQFDGDGRTSLVRPVAQTIGTAFRADAKAEGQTVIVGGWECVDATPPSKARWFSTRLDRRSAPWAFARGEPFRSIAALELYATLLSYALFSPQWAKATRGSIKITGITDNLGNTFAVTKLMTSKFPSVVVLAELSEQLRAQQTELSLEWVPRDQNEEADELTNEIFQRFDMNRRISVDPLAMKWLIMDQLFKVAEGLYADVRAARTAAPNAAEAGASRRRKRRPEERLRARDPW